MKNLKKVTALVIVLAMALSCVAFASFSDVAGDASYNEAVEVMSSLGLLKGYEDGTFGPDKTITRAEFSAVIVRALGMEDAAAGASVNTVFPDVPASHWASGYVQVASQQKIVLGYEDGTFGPDDEVLYEQAVTMIERALKYDIKFAEDEDAYPTSYLAQANADNITAGAAGKIGDKATRAIVARLVYNALNVPMMVQTGIGGIYGDQYSVSTKGETLLTSKLKVAKVEGVVNGLNFGKEDANKVAFDVTVGDNNYDLFVENDKDADVLEGFSSFEVAEGVDVAAMKGFSCVAYVDMTDDSEPVIVAIAPKSGRNKTLTLTKKQLAVNGFDAANDKLSYYKNNKNDTDDLTVKIDSKFKAYANKSTDDMGDAAFAKYFDDEEKDFVKITLINNDTDAAYEVALVEEYASFVVESANANNGTIYANGSAYKTYGSNRVKLDDEDETLTWSLKNTTGEDITLADIAKDNVVNIAVSTDADNNTFYDIIVSNTVVSGVVSEKNIEGTTNYFVIGDGEYKVTNSNSVSVKVGDEGAFVVDMAGNILSKTTISGSVSGNFAFVIATEVDSEFNTKTYKMSIMNQAGEFSVVTLAEKIRLNDGTQADADTVYTDAAAFAKLEGTLVAYTMNTSNEVSRIYTDFSKLDTNYATVGPKTLAYKDDGRIGSYFVEEDLTIINSDVALANATKADLSIVSVSALSEDEPNGYNFDTIVYDANDNTVVIAVGIGIKAIAARNAAAMIVTGTGSSTDSEGEEATNIKGYVDGELVTVKMVADAKVQNMKGESISYTPAKGDVIQYSADANGETAGVRVLYTAAELLVAKDGVIAGDLAKADEGYFAAIGAVKQISGRTVYYRDKMGAEEAVVSLAGNVPTALIVADKGAVKNINAVDYSYSDVKTDKATSAQENTDKLFVVMYENAPLMAIILTEDGSYY